MKTLFNIIPTFPAMKRVVEEITELDIQIGSLFEEGGTKGNYCKNYKIKSAVYKVIFNDVM